MRQDMTKVIVERPRRGYRFSVNKGEGRRLQRMDIEELPYRQSMRAPWRSHRREFDDHLKPLERYLHKQAGRPWSEVYSEICQHADSRSVVGNHLREHVFYMVDQDVREVDGELIGRWGSPGNLYVHPRTGLLISVKPRARRRYQHRKEYEMVAIDSHHKYVLLDGLWFLVTLRDLPENKDEAEKLAPRDRQDVVLKDYVYGHERAYFHNRFRQVWGDNLYACAKRQVGSREIAKILLIKDDKFRAPRRQERNVSLSVRGR